MTKRSQKKERLLHWRVVIDTNVIISSIWKNPSRDIVNLWKRGKIQLLVNEEIVDEYLDVLSRFVPISVLRKWELWFTHPSKVTFLSAYLPEYQESRDPTDNKFLEVAMAGAAKHIISKDKDLLVLKIFKGIEIVTPKVFWEIFKQKNR